MHIVRRRSILDGDASTQRGTMHNSVSEIREISSRGISSTRQCGRCGRCHTTVYLHGLNVYEKRMHHTPKFSEIWRLLQAHTLLLLLSSHDLSHLHPCFYHHPSLLPQQPACFPSLHSRLSCIQLLRSPYYRLLSPAHHHHSHRKGLYRLRWSIVKSHHSHHAQSSKLGAPTIDQSYAESFRAWGMPCVTYARAVGAFLMQSDSNCCIFRFHHD